MESWERAETLTRMFKHGIRRVRGWLYTTRFLSQSQVESAYQQICEKFDLCRKCGRNDHFIHQCKADCRAPWYFASTCGVGDEAMPAAATKRKLSTPKVGRSVRKTKQGPSSKKDSKLAASSGGKGKAAVNTAKKSTASAVPKW
jgi:hypothetical protein